VKDWIRRWLATEKPSTRDFENLAAAAIESLAEAQKAHISDLRVLIDKGHEREAQLSEMVRLAMQHQFYRPSVTSSASGDNKQTPAIPTEHLQDVTVFDEDVDREQIEYQEKELQTLINEQNEAGIHKTGV